MSYLYRNGTGRNDITYTNDLSIDIQYLERYMMSSRTGIRFFTGEEQHALILERTNNSILDDIQWTDVEFESEMHKNMYQFLTDCYYTYNSGISYRVRESSTAAYTSSSFSDNIEEKYFYTVDVTFASWYGGASSAYGFAISASSINNAIGAVSYFNDKYTGLDLFTKYTAGDGTVMYNGVGTFAGAVRNTLSSTNTGVLLKFNPSTCNWINTGSPGIRFYYE